MVHIKLLRQFILIIIGTRVADFFNYFDKIYESAVEISVFIFFLRRFEKYNRKDVFRLLN